MGVPRVADGAGLMGTVGERTRLGIQEAGEPGSPPLPRKCLFSGEMD